MAPSSAAELKEQGNALFMKKDFVRAHEKYTEAIAINGKNAVLYANRSACCFGMGKYIDAIRDAKRATETDPGYAKGWSRLATAYEASLEYNNAVRAWEEAMSALPQTEASLTPAQCSQKAQYTAALEESKRRLAAVAAQPFPFIMTNVHDEKPPWQLAEEMLPELQAGGRAMFASSAYLIHFANQEWSTGMDYMRKLKKIPVAGIPDAFRMEGHTAGLTYISNAVMRDSRVFRIDSQDWVDKYNDQVRLESERAKAWPSDGIDIIQQQALQRLKKGGWDAVRPALAVTVRAWIMRAVCDAELRQAPHVAVERLKETLRLLHWGRQVWRDVHKNDRGIIFEETFVRGVKSIYLEKLMATHATANNADKQALLGTLLQGAQEMIEEIEKTPRPTEPNPNEPLDPGFVSSYYIYPAAEAYATVGYCFIQMARSTENPMEQMQYNLLAVKQYSQAAVTLPKDDEKYCWYLQCAIQPMVSGGLPKEKIRDVAKAVRAAMPKMQRIWKNSAFAKQGRDKMIEMALRLAEEN